MSPKLSRAMALSLAQRATYDVAVAAGRRMHAAIAEFNRLRLEHANVALIAAAALEDLDTVADLTAFNRWMDDHQPDVSLATSQQAGN